MTHAQRGIGRLRHAATAAGTALVLAGFTLAGVVTSAGAAHAAAQGPCDIYAAGGTPCVAAHSTTRALYAAYDGDLYQVRRSSDSTTLDIGVASAGGYANAAAQDSFCAGTTCVITEIYDQSGHGNNLTDAPAGGAAGGPDNLADALAARTTLAGHEVYGVFVAPGTGYRDDATSGIATGDNAESEYDVVDGTHYNSGCCFDYGNAETNAHDDGNGTMEAIYFGTEKYWGYGSGNGPWIMADLENGLYSGASTGLNSADQTTSYRYTTAMVEGGANQWAILGGNAQSGGLTTDYSGVRPSGYNPMSKQGAILLGIGGDNSKGSAGTFYEGVMTTGYASAATEAAVQANIVAAGYGSGGQPSTGPLNAVGSGRCLDDPSSTTTQGTQQEIYTCNGGANQTWTHTSSGQLSVTLSGTTLCLDADGQGTTAGTKVILWACNGGTNQEWNLNADGTITGAQSGLCLDVNQAVTTNGGLIQLWTCNGGTNQQWSLG